MTSQSQENAHCFGKVKHLGSGRFAKVSLLEKNETSTSVTSPTSVNTDSNKVYTTSVDLPATGSTCKCDDLEQRYVALKRISRRYQSKRGFQREIQSQAATSDHPCVTKLMTAFVYQTETEFGLGLEYSPCGNLTTYVTPGVGLPEVIVKSCVVQISHALQYIHNRNFAHLDLKPENILIHDSDSFHVKLCDFGGARELGTSAPQIDSVFCTPYSPPELLRHKVTHRRCQETSEEEVCALSHHPADRNRLMCRKRFAGKSPTGHEGHSSVKAQPRDSPDKPMFMVKESCDVWSLGVLVMFLISGETPWSRPCWSDLGFKEFTLWRKGDFSIIPRIFEKHFTDWSRELLVGVMNPNPGSRWDFQVFRSLMCKDWRLIQVKWTSNNFPLFCNPLDVADSNKCSKCFCVGSKCLCKFI